MLRPLERHLLLQGKMPQFDSETKYQLDYV